ncbi:uncharacterized protein MAL13P1.304-like [Ctenocephalides felis]|uniref:uncharacterized protein MAL13P1.304-like n=1 Tax=Ctenocephalides felis TaxID=7515 RepID=UPI000E6E4BA4|nr:uncharacterized protein MAL13P1.304-like [Ctenocephalides felis]
MAGQENTMNVALDPHSSNKSYWRLTKLIHYERDQCLVQTEIEEYNCHRCNKTFDSQHALSKHDCFSDSSCQFCGKTFLKSRLVKSHEKYCQYSRNIFDDSGDHVPRKIMKRSVRFLKESDMHVNYSDDYTDSNTTAKGVDAPSMFSEQIAAKSDSYELSNKRYYFKPSLKLKIKKEHGTLNSTIVEDRLNSDIQCFASNTPSVTRMSSRKQLNSAPTSNYMCEISTNSLSYEAFNKSNDNYSETAVTVKTEAPDTAEIPENSASIFENNESDQYLQTSQPKNNILPVITSTVSLNPSIVRVKSEPNDILQNTENAENVDRNLSSSTLNRPYIQVKLEVCSENQHSADTLNQSVSHDRIPDMDKCQNIPVYIKSEPIETEIEVEPGNAFDSTEHFNRDPSNIKLENDFEKEAEYLDLFNACNSSCASSSSAICDAITKSHNQQDYNASNKTIEINNVCSMQINDKICQIKTEVDNSDEIDENIVKTNANMDSEISNTLENIKIDIDDTHSNNIFINDACLNIDREFDVRKTSNSIDNSQFSIDTITTVMGKDTCGSSSNSLNYKNDKDITSDRPDEIDENTMMSRCIPNDSNLLIVINDSSVMASDGANKNDNNSFDVLHITSALNSSITKDLPQNETLKEPIEYREDSDLKSCNFMVNSNFVTKELFDDNNEKIHDQSAINTFQELGINEPSLNNFENDELREHDTSSNLSTNNLAETPVIAVSKQIQVQETNETLTISSPHISNNSSMETNNLAETPVIAVSKQIQVQETNETLTISSPHISNNSSMETNNLAETPVIAVSKQIQVQETNETLTISSPHISNNSSMETNNLAETPVIAVNKQIQVQETNETMTISSPHISNNSSIDIQNDSICNTSCEMEESDLQSAMDIDTNLLNDSGRSDLTLTGNMNDNNVVDHANTDMEKKDLTENLIENKDNLQDIQIYNENVMIVDSDLPKDVSTKTLQMATIELNSIDECNKSERIFDDVDNSEFITNTEHAENLSDNKFSTENDLLMLNESRDTDSEIDIEIGVTRNSESSNANNSEHNINRNDMVDNSSKNEADDSEFQWCDKKTLKENSELVVEDNLLNTHTAVNSIKHDRKTLDENFTNQILPATLSEKNCDVEGSSKNDESDKFISPESDNILREIYDDSLNNQTGLVDSELINVNTETGKINVITESDEIYVSLSIEESAGKSGNTNIISETITDIMKSDKEDTYLQNDEKVANSIVMNAENDDNLPDFQNIAEVNKISYNLNIPDDIHIEEVKLKINEEFSEDLEELAINSYSDLKNEINDDNLQLSIDNVDTNNSLTLNISTDLQKRVDYSNNLAKDLDINSEIINSEDTSLYIKNIDSNLQSEDNVQNSFLVANNRSNISNESIDVQSENKNISDEPCIGSDESKVIDENRLLENLLLEEHELITNSDKSDKKIIQSNVIADSHLNNQQINEENDLTHSDINDRDAVVANLPMSLGLENVSVSENITVHDSSNIECSNNNKIDQNIDKEILKPNAENIEVFIENSQQKQGELSRNQSVDSCIASTIFHNCHSNGEDSTEIYSESNTSLNLDSSTYESMLHSKYHIEKVLSDQVTVNKDFKETSEQHDEVPILIEHKADQILTEIEDTNLVDKSVQN